jgi:hypothetical protein
MKVCLYVKIAPRIEVFFIRTWIEHYLKLGIDRIFVYNNGYDLYDKRFKENPRSEGVVWVRKKFLENHGELSDEDIEKKLYDIVDDYDDVYLKSWKYGIDHTQSHIESQISGYKDCTCNNSSDYWLHCDADEFFVFPKHDNIKDFINDKKFEKYSTLWFGSELYFRRKINVDVKDIPSSNTFRKSYGNWRLTSCGSKSLVKNPIQWRNKNDSNIHKTKSKIGDALNVRLEDGYFNHYLLPDDRI